MTLSWPNHLFTLDEWTALPEIEDAHVELAEGLVVMSPKPLFGHQHAGNRLTYRVNEQLPPDLIALAEVEIVVVARPPTVRAPDMIVTRTARYGPAVSRIPAADVLLAVEILSDGTRRVDRVLKFSEYAEAGIPQYWIIDLDRPASLLAHTLVDGAYELSGEQHATITHTVAGHPVTIDLDALTRR